MPASNKYTIKFILKNQSANINTYIAITESISISIMIRMTVEGLSLLSRPLEKMNQGRAH